MLASGDILYNRGHYENDDVPVQDKYPAYGFMKSLYGHVFTVYFLFFIYFFLKFFKLTVA